MERPHEIRRKLRVGDRPVHDQEPETALNHGVPLILLVPYFAVMGDCYPATFGDIADPDRIESTLSEFIVVTNDVYARFLKNAWELTA